MAAARMRETPAHIMAPRLIMLLAVLGLVLLGLVMVYSTSSVIALVKAASPDEVNPMADMLAQLRYAGVGAVAAFVIYRFFPPSVWRSNFVYIVWAAALVLLVLTELFGTGEDEWGAKRWLSLGPLSLQASEFAKIALVLVAARLFADMREGLLSVKAFFVQVFVLLLVPVFIILKLQSDLGTAMICVVGVFAVMWLGEVPGRTMAIVAAVVVAVGAIGVLSEPYRLARLMVFMDPWNDGEGGYGTGYQLIHSLYAIAGGGAGGAGLGNSHEKFLYLTQSESDFIFAIVAEELGLWGAAGVIVLFLLLLYAGMRIARSASDNFGTMVAGGLTIMIAFQAFLNIAMVIGWFPVVGKPLPFISSGGSSLIASLMMVGLILSVSRDAAAPDVYDRRRADLRVVRAAPEPPRGGSTRKGRR
ncbi:FtsW/RodA/SpoVE family cell cycle protein [Arabiibacter massiliensis]|uniref:FtsW/RodA/SpoVE family cell cycle protein n=1 Tax=Arabiibacter massiliensis TaxID=1870985 RepID=UPI0009B9FC77|nr:putative peptidoglycan glycosyltransferase FtsW [Arabiibacter massiliensis]